MHHVRCRFWWRGRNAGRCSSAADVVVGACRAKDAIAMSTAIVQTMIEPSGSVHAHGGFYQRHIAGVLTERALQTATRGGVMGH